MFTLIQLPYAMEALEPVISAETISFHHGKHLQAYVDNLNKLLPGSGFEGLSVVDIVRQAPAGAFFNNAGQILNHEMYFTQFKPAENVTEGPVPSVTFYISSRERAWYVISCLGNSWVARRNVSARCFKMPMLISSA